MVRTATVPRIPSPPVELSSGRGARINLTGVANTRQARFGVRWIYTLQIPLDGRHAAAHIVYMEQFTDADKARFWKRVEKSDGCWLWTGAKASGGYGCMMLDGKPRLAHRISYAMHNNDLIVRDRCDVRQAFRKPVYVLHSCDTPLCVNPDHLRLGTVIDNLGDMVSRKRHTFGQKHPSAKLNPDLVREIRKLDGSKEAIEEMARKLSVSVSAVNSAYRGWTWATVDEAK